MIRDEGGDLVAHGLPAWIGAKVSRGDLMMHPFPSAIPDLADVLGALKKLSDARRVDDLIVVARDEQGRRRGGAQIPPRHHRHSITDTDCFQRGGHVPEAVVRSTGWAADADGEEAQLVGRQFDHSPTRHAREDRWGGGSDTGHLKNVVIDGAQVGRQEDGAPNHGGEKLATMERGEPAKGGAEQEDPVGSLVRAGDRSRYEIGYITLSDCFEIFHLGAVPWQAHDLHIVTCIEKRLSEVVHFPGAV